MTSVISAHRSTLPVLLHVDGLHFAYGTGSSAHVALGDITFDVREREFVSIVGPSGCGKTTLLRCLAGLAPATSGEVSLSGFPIAGPPEELALVFQDYGRSLYPWMTVQKNVLFPINYKRLSKSERLERAADALEAVGLSGYENYYPWQLSGGMQQRVAIARALAYRPRVLLMDEPFASVDAQTRADLEDVVLNVHRQFDMTTIFVTHDIDESVYLADRVLVLCKSPSRAIADIPVELPRPRDQIATKELPEFVNLRAEVARLIRAAAQNAVDDQAA
jgi:NitT/TauT family transport system ATP-binding protein